ncbi:hypothetical protein L1F29_17270 [Paenibacillus spongiae]|uniref:Uncharacterized protein n=1 Tax=Paenibacillus spongiae TaxID=2909671 RepID=A0ABY5SJQ5_9BACL|nr:hypothetical protein [Paenibacillus spongiae]UVI33665.1 hypothetical protein L1F29_17270 [Paenibacillus spongiae]
MDCRRYHGEYADITWRDSDLRKWSIPLEEMYT